MMYTSQWVQKYDGPTSLLQYDCMKHLQVNNNGLISFTEPTSEYSFPLRMNSADNAQLIAPFWADVDTRTGGSVSYRESMDKDDMVRAQRDIRMAFPGQADDFKPRLVFVVTWDHVGYFDRHLDKVHIQHNN